MFHSFIISKPMSFGKKNVFDKYSLLLDGLKEGYGKLL